MFNHWIFRCKDTTLLVSRSMDEKLPLVTRLGITLHLLVCHLCRKYKHQLKLMGKAIKKLEADSLAGSVITPLPDQAKKRINQQLKDVS